MLESSKTITVNALCSPRRSDVIGGCETTWLTLPVDLRPTSIRLLGADWKRRCPYRKWSFHKFCRANLTAECFVCFLSGKYLCVVFFVVVFFLTSSWTSTSQRHLSLTQTTRKEVCHPESVAGSIFNKCGRWGDLKRAKFYSPCWSNNAGLWQSFGSLETSKQDKAASPWCQDKVSCLLTVKLEDNNTIWTVLKQILLFCVWFQMNTSLEIMDLSNENVSMVHLDAPILPEKSDMSNLTIIQTSNGSIIESDGMFLNTAAAQALSGIFVWSALLITCHQVSAEDWKRNLSFC